VIAFIFDSFVICPKLSI